MSQICDVTGKQALKGNQVSHAMNHKIKFQKPNIHKKRFWVPGENKWVSLRVSAHGIRIINKIGIKAALHRIAKKKAAKAISKMKPADKPA